ncbi:erythrocyte membrane protein 1, PfEMP1, putative [Plasmodium sp. gorilla clade G2]|uniref:erythrocyte membrane protein 1, PfEMP1, putative n=1 Tax=Plasmodium sp. gorilla clade G2 TaxID=880535 RepID=UPI000D20A48F|nr:erythrocyte membrane protein 1, PfEMP1, putative [Plasmodium sp. gorilla clade G2]SOV12993.1 erythrocyte membrane protein 1, PfEMP1, putative [Plasmodium sp. gorilla clade G2]
MGNNISRRDEILEKYKDILEHINGKEAKDWYYWDYITYLENDIKKNKPWEKTNFLQILRDNGGVPVEESKKFCRWKEVQKEIFDAVIEHHQYDYYYPWERDVERILNQSSKTTDLMKNDCSQIDIIEKETKNSKTDKESVCLFNTTDIGSCLPSRRSNLFIDGIKTNISATEEYIDKGLSVDAVKPLFLGSVVGSLANKAKTEIQKLKNSGKPDAYICKIMKRNISDYKDLFLGKDIVSHGYSKELQCRLEKIRKYIKEEDETKYSQLLDNKIKEIVQKDLDGLIDESGNKCTLHNTSETQFQCLRFLEEWFEEFLKQQQNILNNIIHRCVNNKSKIVKLVVDGKNIETTCDFYCKGYTDFLKSSRSCYETYRKKCKENIMKTEDKSNSKMYEESVAQAEINSALRKIINKSKCPKHICGDYNVDLLPYFDPSYANFFLHKGYHCGCENNTGNNNYKRLYNNNDRDNKVETVLNELSLCSMNDEDLDGTVGSNGEKVITLDGNAKNICNIRFVDLFLRKKTADLCTTNYRSPKVWMCSENRGIQERLIHEWKNKACLAPRTQALCLGYLHVDNNGITYNKIDTIDSNEKLLTELVYAAITEGRNLKSFFASRHQRSGGDNLCNALKYSFADLGDIVRGRSIWENGYTKSMENNLKEIFKRIYNKLPSEKQSIYKNDKNNPRDTSYHYLRETWWNTNREYIWKALRCGAGMNTPNSCGADVAPNIDYMPQFLRWFAEWSGYFCEEKNSYDIPYIHIKSENEDKNIKSMCTGCNYNRAGDCLNSYPESGHISSDTTCSKCKTMCEKYTEWIRNQKSEYEKQKNKYQEEIKKAQNEIKKTRTNKRAIMFNNSKNVTEFFTKIEKDYPQANNFLHDTFKETDCDQNVEPINFEREQNTFHEKHRYCRTCAEQKHLEDAIGEKFLPDGRPGHHPNRPVYTGTTIVPKNTTGSQNISGGTVPGISVGDVKEEKPKHECDEIFVGKWNEWDCTKTNINHQPVCMKKNDIDYDKEFFDLFNEWIKDFLKEHKQFITKVESCINNNGGNISNCPNEECRNHCHCYNKWAHNKQKEWNSQKEFFKTNNKESFELFSHGGNDYYLDLYLDNLHFLNDFGIHENTTPSSQIQEKINDAIYKSEDCVKKCPKPIKCEDKGFDNDWQCDHATSSLGYTNKSMCLRKGDDKYEKPNLNELDTVYKFYDVFNEWLNDMQRLLEENIEILKSSCTNKFISMKNNTKNNKNNCNICRDDCKCYDNLRKKINEQWEKQKNYFELYKDYKDNMMRNIDLDTYLEAQCEYNLTEKGKDESEAQQKCSKRNTNSGSNSTIFDEMLENKTKKKQSVCESCEKVNENKPVDEKTCKKIKDATDCRGKEFDGLNHKNEENKKWSCKSDNSKSEIKEQVCVPPRGQSVCIANMVDNAGKVLLKDTKEDLEKKLISAIKKETKLLWDKFGNKGTNNDKACRLTYRSFNDFKHMVLGDSLWRHQNIKKLEDKIGEIIKNGGKSGTDATIEERQKWWKEYEKHFWDAVKCGIKAAKPDASGNECPRLINDDDQFEWWAKEWSDDFYDKRKELVVQVEAACNGSNGCSGSNTTPSTVCSTKCTQYKDFLTLKRKEWTDNFKKHLEQTHNQDKYSPHNFYLLYPCTYHSCDGTYIKDLLGDKEYGELQKKCKCGTLPQIPEEKNPCSDKFEFHACNEKKYDLGSWSSLYVKNVTDRGKVYAPPRRNSICIGWLFSPLDSVKSGNKNAAKSELRQKIIDAAKGEVHYLHKYYKDKQVKSGVSPSGTVPPVYCDALKRSFADIGDMVKGTDMWMAGYSPLVEQNIYNVFAMKDTSATTPPIEEQIEKERKEWWDQNKDNVWETMSKCDKNNTCEKNTPTDDKKPQFLRWLEEWGEYICEERENQMNELQNKCNDSKNDVESDKKCGRGSEDCKKQCSKYNNWINVYKREWLGQKSKYKEIYGNKDKPEYEDYKKYVNTDKTSNDYINSKCDKCKTSGSKSGGSNNINLDDVFQKRDDQYKKYEPFCTTCRVNKIADTVKKKQKRGRANPCAKPSGSQPTTSVYVVAQHFQEQAKKKLDERGGDHLQGNAEKGEYKRDSKVNKLEGGICNIDIKHSNDKRNIGDGEPCKGKGTGNDNSEHTRFVVGFQWKTDNNNMHPNHLDVIMSPRRRHICTSNLEHLKTESGPLAGGDKGDDGKLVNNSFLGDVLLTANQEAKKIIEQYKEKNKLKNAQDPLDAKHQATICRAVRSSFADIGDIIRGMDLWSKNSDMMKLEKNLKEIFIKIKGTVSDKNKYATDTDNAQLRKDWWEANRTQIWQAMKCHLSNLNDTSVDPSSNGNCGYSDSVPMDDYIPQRLRWMTEWAEWFCKAQKNKYEELMKECKECTNSSISGRKGGAVTCTECEKCKKACGKYSTFITNWGNDWKTQSKKYKEYMTKVNDSGKDENEKTLLEFFKKLKDENNGNTTFENAEVYVHDIGNFDDCKEQNVFCENSGKNDYAFEEYPKDYKDQCTCTTPANPPAARPPAAAAAKPAATKPATTKPRGGGAAGRSIVDSNTPVISTTKTSDGATVTTTVSFTPSGPDNTVDPLAAGGSGSPQPDSQPGKDSGSTGGQSSTVNPGSSKQEPQPPASTAPSSPPTIVPNGEKEKKKQQNSVPQPNHIRAPKDPLNCVDTAAYYLSKEAKNALDNVKSKLQGSEQHNVYTPQKKVWGNSGSCKITHTTTGQTYSCDGNENPFDDEKGKWDCYNGTNRLTIGNICLPVRRKYMCTKPLEKIDTTSNKTSEVLFKNVLLTAAYEGKHLKEQWEKMEKTPNARTKIKMYELCDAIKYSFADLGDIIRGRDNYKGTNGNSSKGGSNRSNIEEKLKTVFENIQKINDLELKYPNDKPNFHKLRSAWWDANRESIWEAMTCSAPENAPLRKYLKDSGIDNLLSSRYKCGHDDDPPTDDYIPQGFRWIKEWSENYCNAQKKQLDILKKECGECDKNTNDLACMMNSNTKDRKCTNCADTCKEYTNMINTWYNQWTKQQEMYKELYNSRTAVDINKRHIKEFLDKINDKCKDKPVRAEEFIKEASYCTHLTFDKTKSTNNNSYSFEYPPYGYKVLCGTQYRKSCKALKRIGSHKICETKYALVGEGSKWKKLLGYNIYVPPRTQQLCLKPLEALEITSTKNLGVAEHIFSMRMQASAYNEAKLLYEYFKGDDKVSIYSNDSVVTDDDIKQHTLEAMKRSYADYGDLIKGTTKYDYNGTKTNLEDYIKTKLQYDGTHGKTSEDLWNKHKSDIWQAMICGYNDAKPNKPLDDEDVVCELPNNDTEKEFLRWFTEWTEDFCALKRKEIQKVNDACQFNNCEDANNETIGSCQKSCAKYKTWVQQKKNEYRNQSLKYNNYHKNSNQGKESHEFLKEKCKEKCECIAQKVNNDNIDKVFDEYPKEYKMKCECSPYSLNKCPYNNRNNEICKRFEQVRHCSTNTFDNKLSEWSNELIKSNTVENKGVLLPPRRRHLCTISLRDITNGKMDINGFKMKLLHAAYSQGRLLRDIYSKYTSESLQAMKYSFADYGDIVKGTDMMGNLNNLNERLRLILNKKGNNQISDDPKNWWDNNKKHVWHSMLCGYRKGKNASTNETLDNTWCSLPNEDNTNQFLRWLTEWSQQYCKEKITISQTLKQKCNNIVNGKDTPNNIYSIKNIECKKLFSQYENWILSRNNEWKGLSEKYNNIKNNNKSGSNIPSEDSAEKYVRSRCNSCMCNLKDMVDISKYGTDNDNAVFKELVKIIEFDTDSSRTQIQNISQKINLNPNSIKTAVDTMKDILSYGLIGTMGVTEIGLKTGEYFKKKIYEIYNEIIKPVEKKGDTSSNNNNIYENPNILIPTGIGTALTIGWLLFKKKPQITSTRTNLFRVIDIPQNDYSIPTEKSSNKYVPYRSHGYKGKTYIYVEGEETDDYSYLRDISSSDVTSSESEYEDLDINDIYPYKSPKYKTLIEVVLKPTKSDITYSADTPNSGTIPPIPSDIPTNKITDDEWNELKQDFILKMLQNDNMDISRENISGNIYMDNPPHTVDNRFGEKPFITQIQDRYLHGDNQVSYNIDWNIPKQKEVTSNIMDIPTYVSQNLYSGTDLINDSLNGNEHIDIYDELLKRKENELFGTKYMKHTTTNSVSKKTNSDPISNQIDLFHKWLDRHRVMCEQWNNKEEMLSKLNDEWNKSNTIHMSEDNYDENKLKVLLVHEEYNLNNTRTN